jgi:hypothetical protein
MAPDNVAVAAFCFVACAVLALAAQLAAWLGWTL